MKIFDAAVGTDIGNTSQVRNNSALSGSTLNDVLATITAGAVGTARQVISGAGLTGGGDLSADRTLAVGAGTGITVNADDVALASTARSVIDAQPASNVDLGTNTTLTKAAHQGKLLNCTAAIALTVDNSTDFDAWGECQIYAGGGTVTITATATVRRVGSDPLTIPQYGRAVLMRNATTDEYVLTGRLG